jgi:hypothetical protein
VLGTDPKAGSRVLVEDAGVVAVGAEVSVASDTDPQAITASMVIRLTTTNSLINVSVVPLARFKATSRDKCPNLHQ